MANRLGRHTQDLTASQGGAFGARDCHELIRRAGAIVVTGAMVATLVPAPAIAAGGTSTGTAAASSAGTPPSMPSGGGQGGGGANTQSYDYAGSYSATLAANGQSVSSKGKSLSSTSADKNVALVQNGGTLTLTSPTLTKSGDDGNGDNCNFYGVNSILLAVGSGSTAKVSKGTLSATSEGSNGIFATDSATAYANGTSVKTTADNSRGLDATYGGTIVANRMAITTKGDHSAALATDRGGGSVSVTNSTLTTAGSGSPLLYSTGDVEANNVTGLASGSQIAGMEGLNTILINNSTLSSTQTGKTASDPVANGVIIYQSTSGDADTTTGEKASFQAANSTLRSSIASGSMFYCTNTTASIVLSNTKLDFDSTKADLLLAAGNDSNSWGTAGSNGATVTFTGIGETMSGNIEADTISKVDVYLTDSSTWSGAAAVKKNATASTSDSPLNVNVDKTSTWVVTANSTVSNLTVAKGGKVVDSDGKTVTIVCNGQTVVEGTSDVTVTVNGTYSTNYDPSGAGTLATSTIDRSAFDEAYGTSTAFTMETANSTSSATGSSTTTDASGSSTAASGSTNSEGGASIQQFFAAIVSFFKGLFGLG
ncbi:MAG: hypothetical protein ACI38Z_04145 [Parafannyhessea sp.]|uniref:hypothetical protein n=1 Tax=Parafannyhessea sp. TaxID=2847324 RepID=UPI003F08636E